MKKTKILWGIALLAVALLLILNSFGITLGLPAELPVWKLILAGILVVFIINRISKLKISAIFFPLVFIAMLFEGELAGALGIEGGDIGPAYGFLLVGLLLTAASVLLIPKRKNKKAKKGFGIRHNTCYIDCSSEVGEYIENSLGYYEVFFENVDMYKNGGTLRIENNMGKIDIHVPSCLKIDLKIENNLGVVEGASSGGSSDGRSLGIFGENNMGKIAIIYDK